MGYDVEFLQLPEDAEQRFPADARADDLLKRRIKLNDPAGVRELLLKLPGCRPGPGETVDYFGRGLNHARMTVKPEGVHVENNCGGRELLKIYNELKAALPGLVILDLQSGQVHDAASLEAWWAKPL